MNSLPLLPKRIFLVAGVYGLVGITTVWQILFLAIARDPVRHKPLMIVFVLEKLSFVIAMAVLLIQERIHSAMLIFLFIDLTFAILFLLAYFKTEDLHSADTLIADIVVTGLFEGFRSGESCRLV